MRFEVLRFGDRVQGPRRSTAVLYPDNWNDYWTYQTQFYLSIFDEQGQELDIGQVKIGRFNMRSGMSDLPPVFEELDDRFFSVGQDESYYSALNSAGDQVRDEVLRALRDVAADATLMRRAAGEEVMNRSLLRSVSTASIEGQFRRLATGGARLSRFHVEYTTPQQDHGRMGLSLTFDVEPESAPPTNIHVLIGRNGVGKTHLLHHMCRAIYDRSATFAEAGTFTVTSSDSPNGSATSQQAFTSLVIVSFSAFDRFDPLTRKERQAAETDYVYIGLKKVPQKRGSSEASGPKDLGVLAREFSDSIKICHQGARRRRWRRALEILESDPIFADAQIATIAADDREDDGDPGSNPQEIFRNLSSGHKIVLLTITRLVEHVAERSLVLLDEPEAHLHPPLLAAFVRALSDLLIDRNGVAIVATHSPVVLQEVPADCVWIMHRSGRLLDADRPRVETFGENIGVLTREVFGLEVTRSGFHRMLEEAAASSWSYEDVLEKFGGRLGGEARAIVRALFADRR